MTASIFFRLGLPGSHWGQWIFSLQLRFPTASPAASGRKIIIKKPRSHQWQFPFWGKLGGNVKTLKEFLRFLVILDSHGKTLKWCHVTQWHPLGSLLTPTSYQVIPGNTISDRILDIEKLGRHITIFISIWTNLSHSNKELNVCLSFLRVWLNLLIWKQAKIYVILLC